MKRLKWTYDHRSRWKSGRYEIVRYQHGPAQMYGVMIDGVHAESYTALDSAKEKAQLHAWRELFRQA